METVLITGANKGIGLQVAQELAGRGMRVLVGSRDRARGEAAVKSLRAKSTDEIYLLEVDVNSQASIDKAAAEVEQRFGTLDVLVNNAGIAVDRSTPSEATQDRLRQTFDTNFFGAVAVTQAFLPLLRTSRNARIINVSSGLGSLAQHSDPAWPYAAINVLSYCSSKTALNAFTVLLANELRASGIKVNAADPGYTATDLNQHSGHQTVAEGSEAIVSLATAGADSPTGTYISREGVVPW